MADKYIDLGITTELTTLYEAGVEEISELGPEGWTPSPIEEWLLSAVARMGVEVAVLAGQVPLAIFAYFGEAVLGIVALEASTATGSVTFTLADTAGHTIEIGTQLDIDGVAFLTTAELGIATGLSTGSVGVEAAGAGSEANDLVGDSVALVSPTYVFVSSVALDAPTSGGLDAEDPEAYVDRLADELTTLSPKAILIEDYEAIARRNPLVGRALGIDNYDPGPPIVSPSEGHVSVAVHDAAGEPLSAGVKSDIAADLAANRVLNIVAHVINPTYTLINVSFTATAYSDYDAVSVKAAAEQAVRDFLDPASWGHPPQGDTTKWVDEPTLRRNDLFGVIYEVPGVRHVTALTLAINPAALGTADLALNTPASLTRPNTITGTVT